MKNKTFILLAILTSLIYNTYCQDYFPMVKGSYWVYDVFFDGSLYCIDSTVYEERTIINDTTFNKYIHYYIKEGSLSETDTFFLYNNFTDSNVVMLSNRNMDVIDSAIYAKHKYIDGESWIAHKIPKDDTIQVEFIGNITVTAGTFSNCVIQGDEYIFAPNVGIIKIYLQNDSSYYDLIRYNIPTSPSGIKQTSKQNTELVPNPVTDFVRIPGTKNLSYKLYTIHGQVIDYGVVNDETINFSHIRTGIYFLQLSNEKEKYTLKMIKK